MFFLLVMTLPLWGDATSSASASSKDRAYELVSSAQKSGGVGGVFPLGELALFGRPIQSAPSGNSVAYSGEDFFEPRLGSIDSYLSTSGEADWATTNVTPGVPSTTEGAVEANTYVGFSPDLSVGVISSNALLTEDPAVPARYANLYIASGTGLHDLRPVITTTPPGRSRFQFGWAHSTPSGGHSLHSYLFFGGGNAGTPTAPAFSHILFSANGALTPNAVDYGRLVDNLYEWNEGQLRLVNVLPDGTTTPNASFGVDYNDEFVNVPLPNLSHVISDSGARIFWTDQSNGGALYVRENGETTKQIDAAVGGGGEYQTANADGSRVFFTKGGHLFEYETESEVTVDLTPSGGVEGLLGISNDGTSVYLVATSVLAAGGTPGAPNLYLYKSGMMTFAATLAVEDNQTPEFYGSGLDPAGDWFRTFAGRTAEVSPDGRYVAFMSIRSLTGYDNTDATVQRQDYEVFVYDSDTKTIACASCNTDGSRPTGSTLLPTPTDGFRQQHYLNDNGQLFFSTTDAVMPQDSNNLSDVYEYQDGHDYLISPANAEDEAVFGDASESGNDLFFTTTQPLVPADLDQITDLYDARVGGRSEAPLPRPCVGEGCLGLPVLSPPTEAPITAVFSGAGNLTSPAPVASPKKTPTVKKKLNTKKRKKKHSGQHSRHRGRTKVGLRRKATTR